MNEFCIVRVFVRTNKKTFGLEHRDDVLYVNIPLLPQKGEANRELLKNLEEIFKCRVEILRGYKSRKKVIRISLSCKDVFKLLRESHA